MNNANVTYAELKAQHISSVSISQHITSVSMTQCNANDSLKLSWAYTHEEQIAPLNYIDLLNSDGTEKNWNV